MSQRKIVVCASSRSVILIVGGDARQGERLVDGTLVRAIASTKFGGNGQHRSLIAAIRRGRVRLALLLARWLGHSEAGAISAACRAAGVRYLIIDGGLSSAWTVVGLEVHRG